MTQTTTYNVEGMKCDGCIKAATRALEQLPGFEAVEFDLKGGTMQLHGDVAPDKVQQTMTDSGYPTTAAD